MQIDSQETDLHKSFKHVEEFAYLEYSVTKINILQRYFRINQATQLFYPFAMIYDNQHNSVIYFLDLFLFV